MMSWLHNNIFEFIYTNYKRGKIVIFKFFLISIEECNLHTPFYNRVKHYVNDIMNERYTQYLKSSF